MQSLHLGHISSCCAFQPHGTRTAKPTSAAVQALFRGPARLFDALRQRCEGDRVTIPHAVINTEVSTADSWALSNRAAMLSLKVEQLNEYIQSNSGANAWLAVCEPQRKHGHGLFAHHGQQAALLTADGCRQDMFSFSFTAVQRPLRHVIFVNESMHMWSKCLAGQSPRTSLAALQHSQGPCTCTATWSEAYNRTVQADVTQFAF
jgi:hypothetical protein